MNIDNRKIEVTKVTDKVFGGSHKNGINPGYVCTGTAHGDLETDRPFYVLTDTGIFKTSTVVKINADDTFDTKNSVYKIELLD